MWFKRKKTEPAGPVGIAQDDRFEAENQQPTFCLGINGWKRTSVAAFLRSATEEPVFLRSADDAVAAAKASGGRVVIWASKTTPRLKSVCADAGVPLLHMEDGFLRSRGLGSSHVVPASLVLDRTGIYFDPTGPSDLETLLQTAEISDEYLEQARRLRRQIVAEGLSKYNVGQRYEIPDLPDDKRIILVPGQVADDASIRVGTGDIATNLALLVAVRRDNPDAFIIYKPHPDVEAANRAGMISPLTVLRHADYIASSMSSDAAIAVVDEICTMTSLIGFEGLLRGKAVTCYGMPFYAGWGITTDRMSIPRRSRVRTVDEVLATAYLLYARYLDPSTMRRIDALAAVRLLAV